MCYIIGNIKQLTRNSLTLSTLRSLAPARAAARLETGQSSAGESSPGGRGGARGGGGAPGGGDGPDRGVGVLPEVSVRGSGGGGGGWPAGLVVGVAAGVILKPGGSGGGGGGDGVASPRLCTVSGDGTEDGEKGKDTEIEK